MAIAELIMPKMGESIMEATILRWHKNVGDRVALDETVLEIATDKVDSEIPSTVAGVITEILFRVNDVVPVGAVIARLEVAASVQTTVAPTPIQPSYNPPPTQPKVEEKLPYVPQQQAPKTAGGNNRFFSPLVLNIANSEGLSLSELERIPGTGAEGRVSKRDVLQYIADKKSGKAPAFIPAPSQPFYTEPTPAPVQQTYSSPQPERAYTPAPPPVYVPQPTAVSVQQEIPQPVFIPPSPAPVQSVAAPVEIQQTEPAYTAAAPAVEYCTRYLTNIGN